MTGCCDDYRCQRKRPIGIYMADLSSRVYAATDYQERSPGRYTAYRRHDITDQVRQFIITNPQWVRAVLRLGK